MKSVALTKQEQREWLRMLSTMKATDRLCYLALVRTVRRVAGKAVRS